MVGPNKLALQRRLVPRPIDQPPYRGVILRFPPLQFAALKDSAKPIPEYLRMIYLGGPEEGFLGRTPILTDMIIP